MGCCSKIPNLPEDIVNSILLELPVKSLLRFKITCKSWCCSIDDLDFMKSHLHKSSTDISRQKFLIFDIVEGKIPCDYSIKVVSTEASISADSKIVSLDQPNIPGFCSTSTQHHPFLQVHSCEGLVLIYHPGNIMLWNPAIRKYKLIPIPYTKQSLPLHRNIRFVFAYDFVSEDYKVLCIRVIKKNTTYPLVSIVEIYSVKNQSWRTIDNNPISPNFDLYTAVSLNGAIHIKAYSDVEGNMVISLYLADEKFIVTPVTSNFGRSWEFVRAFADHVCVFVFGRDFPKQMSIWSLDKDGKTGLLTWNHIIKIPTLGSVIQNIGYAGHFICIKENGNIVWRKYNGLFTEYDVRKNEFTKFKLEEIPSYRRLSHWYVESLVSFKIPWD